MYLTRCIRCLFEDLHEHIPVALGVIYDKFRMKNTH